MGRLDNNTTLLTQLQNNTPFVYAHLVKFERPKRDGVSNNNVVPEEKAIDFAYITDGAYDISFNDGSTDIDGNANGVQIYRANKLKNIGTFTETTEMKVASTSIALQATSIDAALTDEVTVSSTQIAATNNSFVDAGFREGDKIRYEYKKAIQHLNTEGLVIGHRYQIAEIGNSDFSGVGYAGFAQRGGIFTATAGGTIAGTGKVIYVPVVLRIDSFSNNGKTINYTQVTGGTVINETTTRTFELISDEIDFLVRKTPSNNFVNRKVTIYKAFMYANNPHVLIGDPIVLFKGIITGASFKEDPSSGAMMTWQLKNILGDFKQVTGRLTSAEFHQAKDENGLPQRDAAIRPAYAEDFGFQHSEQALNVIATYTDYREETTYKNKYKLGFVTGTKSRTKTIEETREVDLRFNLQSKYIPVIYGVQRVKGLPIFCDLDSDDTSKVYVAYALSEGPIQSILNVYVDDLPLVCIDDKDSAARSGGGEGVDVVCAGNAAEGTVLLGKATSNSARQAQEVTTVEDGEAFVVTGGIGKQLALSASSSRLNSNANNYSQPIQPRTFTENTGEFLAGDRGIIHEDYYGVPSPQKAEIEFHAGLPKQEASSMLTAKAKGTRFKVQEDFWQADPVNRKYWGSNHTLLDTAYTAVRFDLTNEQTTPPSFEYIVKGKFLNGFNYDGSYLHSTLPTYTSESHSNFQEGTLVSFRKTSDNAYLFNSNTDKVKILDKFDYIDIKGVRNYRFRFDLISSEIITLASTKRFYIQDSVGNTWHMVTYDAQEVDGTFTVGGVLTTEVTVTSSGSSSVSANISSPSDTVSDYIPQSVTDSDREEALLRFLDLVGEDQTLTFEEYQELYGTGNAGTGTSGKSSANIATTNSGGTTVNLPSTTSTSVTTATTAFITNKIKLAGSGLSGTTDFYKGMSLNIVKTTEAGERLTVVVEILAYNGTTKVATTEEFGLDMIPSVGDIVEILPKSYNVYKNRSLHRGADERPSINFAIILLDYLLSDRYGAGLSTNDIDLDSFLYAAQLCDTQSDVTVQFNTGVSLTAGDIYEYEASGHLKWRGTVLNTTNNSSSAVFTNVYGKLSNKWNDFTERKLGDLIWYNNVYKVTNVTGLQSSFGTKAVAPTASNAKITKFSGNASSPTDVVLGLNILSPVTGYSLYDSDDIKYWKYLGWENNTQRYVTRHQGNLTVDTAQPVFSNIQSLLSHFNGLLSYVNGKFRLTIEAGRDETGNESDALFNDSNSDLNIQIRYITDEDIIGEIKLDDKGTEKAYNSLTASISDPQYHFDNRSISFFRSDYLKADRSVVKSTSFEIPGITNYFNGRMAAKQVLDRSRFSRDISFTMRPSGLAILPGELIRVQYDRFGWTSASPVLFRVKSVGLNKNCLISITAEEYSDDIYRIGQNIDSAFFVSDPVTAVARIPSAITTFAVDTAKDESANVLTWVKPNGMADEGGYEIYRATSLSGNPSTSVGSHATRIKVVESVDQFTHADTNSVATSAQNVYYWIRPFNKLKSQTTSATSNRRKRYFGPFNADSNYGGVTPVLAQLRAVSDGNPGTDGASVNIIFARASTDISGETVTDGTPPTSNGGARSWSDNIPSGNDTLYAARGTKAAGASSFTFSSPFVIAATAVAEVYAYRKNYVDGSGNPLSTAPSGGSYNFQTNVLTAPTSWDKNPVALTADGDIVSVSVGLATSGNASDTAASIAWGPAVVYAQRQDGSDTIKTVRITRTGTIPSSVPVPTVSEMGRAFVTGDFATIEYSDGTISFRYDGTSWSVVTNPIDGDELKGGSVTNESLEERLKEQLPTFSGFYYNSVNDTTPTGAGEFMMSFFSGTRVSTTGSYSKIGTIRLSKNKRFKNGQLVGQASVANIEVGNIVAIQRTVFSYGVFKVASIVNASSLATDDYISFTVETMPNSTSDAKMFANRGLWNWPVSTGSSGGAGFSVVVSKNDSLSVPGNKSVSSESQSDDVAHASPLFLGSWTSKETGTSSLGANGAFNFLDSSGNEIGNSSSWANIVTARIGKVRNGGASDYFDFERFQVGALVSFGAYHLNFGANGLVPNRATYKISSLVDNTAYVQLNFESASATTSKLYSSKGAWVWGASLGTLNYLRIKVQLLAETETVVDGGAVLDGTVASDKITDGAVSTAKLGDGSITAVKVVDGTLTGTKIADGTITGTKIGASTITGSNFVDGTITGSKIASSTITGTNFVDGTITGSKIASSTITGTNFVNGTITGSKIDAATITGSNIDSATITGNNILNGTITGGKISGTTITGSNMVNGTITGTQIANSTITGGKIASATIVDANIVSGTITGARIASSTLSNSLLIDNTIQGGKIALATIQGGNIATNTITANNITVTTLSSLSANIGSISSGSLQGGTVPDSNSAPSGSETGSFFDLTLGRFVVGNATNYIWWSGTQLVIGGDVIATGNIKDDAISAAKMANNAVTEDTIAADAVVRAKIADNAINANKIASNAITATEIAANTITASQLTTGEFVTATANIGDGIITNAKISTLDAGKINTGLLNASRINVNSILIGDLNGASSFKGGLGNLNNPSSAITPTDNTAANAAQTTANTAVTNAAAAQSTANSKITGAQVNANVTSISGGVITTGTVSANRIDVGSIVIGDLSGASSFKGGLGNLNNPSSAITPTDDTVANGKVSPSQVASHLGGVNTTTISGGIINTGTINGSLVNVTNINATNIASGTLSADRIAADSLDIEKINNMSFASGADGNIGIGEDALPNADGTYVLGNIAFGYRAGHVLNGSGFSSRSRENIFIGNNAGKTATTGNFGNIAIGINSFGGSSSNTLSGATSNICIGNQAAPVLRGSAHSNVYIGTQAGMTATTGVQNVCVGIQTGMNLLTGKQNTCIGSRAGQDITSGHYNVCIGRNAGAPVIYQAYSTLTTGSNNVLIGHEAGVGNNVSNAIAIGYDTLGYASNTARIGDSNMASIGGYANWSNVSDERDKILITNLNLGLNFVNALTPKKFKLNPRDSYKVYNEETEKTTYDQEGFEAGTKARNSFSFGFLAQEVEEKVSELDSDPTDIVDDSNPDRLHLRSSELIAVLWKAVQELSNKNDALEARLTALEDT